MSEKCSTAQSFIRTEMTTYVIGTLGPLGQIIYVQYDNTDCQFFKQGYKIRKIFA